MNEYHLCSLSDIFGVFELQLHVLHTQEYRPYEELAHCKAGYSTGRIINDQCSVPEHLGKHTLTSSHYLHSYIFTYVSWLVGLLISRITQKLQDENQ